MSARSRSLAVAEYIDWFNHRRLHGEIGHVPPVEYETAYLSTDMVAIYRENPVPAVAGTK
ncbi:IS3 family transposase [Gordonia sp. C13]|uniref:IS3 family transposase n=1 Tax=Gordonia sp. C13 TaxID=2935078 RepID=UPI0035A90BF8